jgi:hypothetical protein
LEKVVEIESMLFTCTTKRLSAMTVYVKVLDAVGGAWYPVVAVTVNVPPVETVGVPVINPDGLSVRPAGIFVDEKDWIARPL